MGFLIHGIFNTWVPARAHGPLGAHGAPWGPWALGPWAPWAPWAPCGPSGHAFLIYGIFNYMGGRANHVLKTGVYNTIV